MTITFKKPGKKAIALITAVIVLVTAILGTFAWNSFNQSRINVFREIVLPDVNLHDDFEGGPNKDVYVENSGQKDIFVRVRLTEYLETVAKGSLVVGHQRGDEETEREIARSWAPHNHIEECDESELNINYQYSTSPEWAATDTFHTYYTWLMGGKDTPQGQIYYKPATIEQKGEADANGVVTREPEVVSDPLTGTSVLGDAHLEYKAEVERLMSGGLSEAQAMEELGIKKTLTSAVITMSMWEDPAGFSINGVPYSQYGKGDFWIVDEEDGWCYWANPLKAGEATGLLLDKVERTSEQFDSNSEYCINAWLQAIDYDDDEMIRMLEQEGMSAGAIKLMYMTGGAAVVGSDGATYKYNKLTGTYTMIFDADGKQIAVDDLQAIPFVSLGTPDLSTATDKLAIGSRFAIDDLNWDGDKYEDYLTNGGSASLYNINTSGDAYELIGTSIGRDGNIYLEIAKVTGGEADLSETFYIASVKEDESAGTYTYTQDYPGTAPFAFIYKAAGSTLIGTANDMRANPSIEIEGRNFYHIGNGVYVEVNNKGDTTSKDTPAKYYFAEKILATAPSTVAEAFPLQLTQSTADARHLFTADISTSNGVTSLSDYAPNGKTLELTLADIVTGVNGKLYMEVRNADFTKDSGYIAIGDDNYLGTDGDVRVWAGKDGMIGTADDTYDVPSDFTESFLKNQGITESDMLLTPGQSFTANGIKWMLITVDDYGNRLFATEEPQGNSVFGSSNAYAGSTLASTMQGFFNTKMPDLKPYAQDAFIPALNLNSRALPSKNSPTAFALSQSEIDGFVKGKGVNLLTDDAWTRTATGTAGESLTAKADGSSAANRSVGSSTPYRPAIWVKFSDAAKIANTRDGDLSFLSKNFKGNSGQTFIADGIEWLVLDKDAAGNLLILATQSVNTINQGAVQGYMASNNNLRNWINNTFFTTRMPTLKNYVKLSNANTALDAGTTNNQARNDAAARSKVISSGDGLYTFVLSQSEYNQYKGILIGKSPLNIVWTRSTGGSATTFSYVTGENATNGTLSFAFGGNTAARQVCPAMWVNFGNLD